MKPVNRIIENRIWNDHMSRIGEAEKDRIFCNHNLDHLLHVARIAYIDNLERNLGFSKDIIYSAALLHDIGRGLPDHEKEGARIASEIMEECGFDEDTKEKITDAILSHRNRETASRDDLAGLIYRADKNSRACFNCNAKDECNWPEDKKNGEISI